MFLLMKLKIKNTYLFCLIILKINKINIKLINYLNVSRINE